jgi:hypothetical protein
MDTREFNTLGLDERANLVWNKGVFLSSAHGARHSYSLYAYADFYAEIVITHEKGGRIEDIVPFRRGYRLNKHTAKVNLIKLV